MNGTAGVTGTTNSSGSIVWATPALTPAGTDVFYASFAGDGTTYTPATSTTVTVTVNTALTYSSYEGMIPVNTSTGNQTITAPGFAPTAVVFWWTPQTGSGVWGVDGQMGFGFAANTSPVTQGYVSVAGGNGKTTTVEGRRHNSSAAIGLIQFDGTLLTEATVSFTSAGFTLDWTTAPGGAFNLFYLALGGTGITSAKVVPWTANTTTGNQSITGVGFQPSCVLTIGTGDTAASPDTTTQNLINIGAMDASGNQWTIYNYAQNGVTTANSVINLPSKLTM